MKYSESQLDTRKRQRVALWPWVTAVLGLIVIGLTYASDVSLYNWLENRNMEANYSNPMDWVLGLVGLVLVVGGIVSGVRNRIDRGQ